MTRNRPDQIRGLLRSLTRQTVTPDEVVIIDNASEKSYREVLEEFADTLPLRTFVEETLGPGAARARGVAESRGEIILFIDDDCEAFPDWLENMVAAFEANPNVGQVGGRINDGGRLGTLVEQFGGWDRMGAGRIPEEDLR